MRSMRLRLKAGMGFLVLGVGCHRSAPVERREPVLEELPVLASTPSVTRPIRIVVGGDVLPHRPSLVEPSSIRAALDPLSSTFASADIAIANHEAATGTIDEKSFRLSFAAPTGWLDAVKAAGISGVSVANNHACDLGETGLDATIAAASHAGVTAFGGDHSDPWRARVVAERSGKRVCVVAWTTLVNGSGSCARSRRLAVAPTTNAGKKAIDKAFARAKSDCDATVAIVHGGEEYETQTSSVIDQAAHAAEAGATAIVIHHPHVPSPVIVRTTKDGRRVPIFASVGNLVTNQGESWKPSMTPVFSENRRLVCVNGWTRLGVLADLAFTWEGDRGRLEWGSHLVWTENSHAEDRKVAVPEIHARLLDADGDAAIVARLSEDKRGPVSLFSDPCWVEHPGTPEDRAARCSVRFGERSIAVRTTPDLTANAPPTITRASCPTRPAAKSASSSPNQDSTGTTEERKSSRVHSATRASKSSTRGSIKPRK